MGEMCYGIKDKTKNIVNNYNTTNVKEICDYLDIEIAYTEFKAKTLESRLMIVDGNGYIFVRPNLDERYENFLIAHELDTIFYIMIKTLILTFKAYL